MKTYGEFLVEDIDERKQEVSFLPSGSWVKQTIQVIINPSINDFYNMYVGAGKERTKQNGIRGILSGKDLFIWVAGNATHVDIADAVGLNPLFPTEYGKYVMKSGRKKLVGQGVVFHYLPGDKPEGGPVDVHVSMGGDPLGEATWSVSDISNHPQIQKLFGKDVTVG